MFDWIIRQSGGDDIAVEMTWQNEFWQMKDDRKHTFSAKYRKMEHIRSGKRGGYVSFTKFSMPEWSVLLVSCFSVSPQLLTILLQLSEANSLSLHKCCTMLQE